MPLTPTAPSRRLIKNRLLYALPGGDFARLEPAIERVNLTRGEVVIEAGQRITGVYFPETSVVSLATVSLGEPVEVALVGLESAIGIEVGLGSDRTVHRSVAQFSGSALRISAEVIKREFERSEGFYRQMLRAVGLIMMQIAYRNGCYRLHGEEARLATWFLMCSDRLQADARPSESKSLAMILPASGAISEIGGHALQEAGLIKYEPGEITLLNRQGLEGFACHCYHILKGENECHQS